MTVLFRCRVKKPLLDKANKVTRDLGTSTPEMVRIFLTQIAKTGKVPLKLDPEWGTEDPIAGPQEYRAALLESFWRLITGHGFDSIYGRLVQTLKTATKG